MAPKIDKRLVVEYRLEAMAKSPISTYLIRSDTPLDRKVVETLAAMLEQEDPGSKVIHLPTTAVMESLTLEQLKKLEEMIHEVRTEKELGTSKIIIPQVRFHAKAQA